MPDRLKWLVEQGVLDRREYSHQPPRSEYVLTDKGAELCSLLMVMVAWGDRWTAGDAGPPVLYRHQDCGHTSHPELHCSHCGRPMNAGNIDLPPVREQPRSREDPARPRWLPYV
jgi:HxlR-like helix-turn-helix